MSAPTSPSGPPSDVGLPARKAALALFAAGLESRGGFDAALSLPAFSSLSPRDRAWTRALVATAFRRLGPIDRALDARLKKPPPDAVRQLLQIGAAQLLFRDTPAFAAVSTSVDLARTHPSTKPFAGLVNAVLRALSRDGIGEPGPEAHAPAWLFARWKAAYGEAAAQGIAALIPGEAPTDLSLRDPADRDVLAEALEGQILPGGSLRTQRRGDLSEWPGFSEGQWWVQDAAAAVPARLLDVKPGETALDLCAAPGGKTLQLAAAGASVVALDRSAQRLKRVTENLARMGFKAETVTAEADAWKDGRTFDAVLLDAPCSATGTFRRHPDVLWASRPGDIGSLAGVQARLLDAAAERVKPGGRLVYCVCSLEPEEGEAQVEGFLRRRPDFRLTPASPEAVGAPAEALTAQGSLRILPSSWAETGGLDGFFAARFDRAG